MKNEALISAHPIASAMRAQILDCLRQIETDHDVKVLFACESGSRGWGFASPDSDYDVRFIYVNRLSWYLTVESGRDVLEQPISGDLDVNGWDLRKTLQLLRQSNPTLLEWLRSPIVYREQADAVAHALFETLGYAETGEDRPARPEHRYRDRDRVVLTVVGADAGLAHFRQCAPTPNQDVEKVSPIAGPSSPRAPFAHPSTHRPPHPGRDTDYAPTYWVATAGGYTSNGLHKSLDDKIMPILSNSLVTRPLTAAELEATNFRTTQVITDTRTLRFYYRRLPDNRVRLPAPTRRVRGTGLSPNGVRGDHAGRWRVAHADARHKPLPTPSAPSTASSSQISRRSRVSSSCR